MINRLIPDEIEVTCILQKGKGLSPTAILKNIENEIKKRDLFPMMKFGQCWIGMSGPKIS